MAVLSTRKAVVLVCFAMLPMQDQTVMAQQRQPSTVANAPSPSQNTDNASQKTGNASRETENAAQKVDDATDGFVLLNNDNVLRGTAVQHGNEIIVSRSNGTQLNLRRQQVQCWANTLEDLYRFRVARRSKQDLPAYVADIRWCIRNGLADSGLLQNAQLDLTHAKQLAPHEPTLARLAKEIQRQEFRRALAAESLTNNSTAMAVPDASSSAADEIAQVDFQQTEDPLDQEMDRGTLAGFARDVQPMLLNRCGGCHGQLSDRNWKLLVPTKGSRSSARMTRENFLALSAYLNFDSALESEVRLRAMDGHAGKRYTLGLRETVSSRAFERWLQYAKPVGAALEIAKRELTSKQLAPKTTAITNFDTDVTQTDDSDSTKATAPVVERLPQVANPFDPEIFNRRQQLR